MVIGIHSTSPFDNVERHLDQVFEAPVVERPIEEISVPLEPAIDQESTERLFQSSQSLTNGRSIDRVYNEVAEYMKTMGQFHTSFLKIGQRDVARSEELIDDRKSHAYREAAIVSVLTGVIAALMIGGAVAALDVPSAPATASSAAEMRMNAAALEQFSLKTIQDFLKNNKEMLKTARDVGIKVAEGGLKVSDVLNRGVSQELDAKFQHITQINIQDAQAKKSLFDQSVQQAQNTLSRIQESKARGA